MRHVLESPSNTVLYNEKSAPRCKYDKFTDASGKRVSIHLLENTLVEFLEPI